jgi:hypothetical protein
LIHERKIYTIYIGKQKWNKGEKMRNLQEPTYSFVILTFILIIVDTLLAWFSVRFSPAGVTGVSWFSTSLNFPP